MAEYETDFNIFFLEKVCIRLTAGRKRIKGHKLLRQLHIKSIWKGGKLSQLHLCLHVNSNFLLRFKDKVFSTYSLPLVGGGGKSPTNKKVIFLFDVMELETTLQK